MFHRYKYSSLSELVQACKKAEARGLACLLTSECIKPRAANKVSDGGGKWDIPRSELTKEKELGGGHFGIVYKGVYLYNISKTKDKNNVYIYILARY